MKPSHLITPEKPVLVLRICQPDGSSRNGFIWPTSGLVTCPDWKDTTECGNGLHGWLRGEGDPSAANGKLFTNPYSLWLVILVPAYVELDGKVKFPQGEVVCSGDRLTVTDYLRANGCAGPLISGVVTAGTDGAATAGGRGTATAGYAGTATAGNHGTATAGDSGTATAGWYGIATAGQMGQILIWRWADGAHRMTLGNIGLDQDVNGDLLQANKPYKLNEDNQFFLAN